MSGALWNMPLLQQQAMRSHDDERHGAYISGLRILWVQELAAAATSFSSAMLIPRYHQHTLTIPPCDAYCLLLPRWDLLWVRCRAGGVTQSPSRNHESHSWLATLRVVHQPRRRQTSMASYAS